MKTQVTRNNIGTYIKRALAKEGKQNNQAGIVKSSESVTQMVGKKILDPPKPQKGDKKKRLTKNCGPGTKTASTQGRLIRQEKNNAAKVKEASSRKFNE